MLLNGLKKLATRGCNQLSDTVLAPLESSFQELDMWCCDQRSLEDACLAPLLGSLRSLNICGCNQLTDAVLEGITRLQTLFCASVDSNVSRAAARRARGPRGT